MSLKEVQGAEITCLVDNSIDILLPSSEIAKRPPIGDWFGSPLVAEHGFSAAISIDDGGRKRRILLDSGLSTTAVVHNSMALGYDLSACEAVVSSHGHIDHAGGLLEVGCQLGGSRRVPLVMNPHAFRNREMRFPDGRLLPLPAPKRDLLEQRYELVERTGRSLLLDGRLEVTGEVPRTNTFEKGNPIHFAEADGKMEPDPLIQDDQAVVLNVRDKGLVVLTGCGHAGIVNTLEYAKELTGVDELYFVTGGMHLSGGIFESQIQATIDEIRKLNPTYMVPCHCTGFKAIEAMMSALPGKVILNSVGTSYSV